MPVKYTRKEFDYYVTNLDWGDGTEIEYRDDPLKFDRLQDIEHTYKKPGFYSIKGLVFKHAFRMVSIWPANIVNPNVDDEQNTAEDNNLIMSLIPTALQSDEGYGFANSRNQYGYPGGQVFYIAPYNVNDQFSESTAVQPSQGTPHYGLKHFVRSALPIESLLRTAGLDADEYPYYESPHYSGVIIAAPYKSFSNIVIVKEEFQGREVMDMGMINDVYDNWSGGTDSNPVLPFPDFDPYVKSNNGSRHYDDLEFKNPYIDNPPYVISPRDDIGGSFRNTIEVQIPGYVSLETSQEYVSTSGDNVLPSEGFYEGSFHFEPLTVIDDDVPFRSVNGGCVIQTNVFMDIANNDFLTYKYKVWLPNWIRQDGEVTYEEPNPQPDDLFVESEPQGPPDGYFPPTVENATAVDNKSGTAITVSTTPFTLIENGWIAPGYSEFDVEEFINVGTTSKAYKDELLFLTGKGAWVCTNVQFTGGGTFYTWQVWEQWNGNESYPNGFDQKINALSPGGEYTWFRTNPTIPNWSKNTSMYNGTLSQGPNTNTLSHWIYMDGEWILNDEYADSTEDGVFTFPVGNPTRYYTRIRAIRSKVDAEGQPLLNEPNYADYAQKTTHLEGTNSWQEIEGEFYAASEIPFVRILIFIQQLDYTKDRRPTGDRLNISENPNQPPRYFDWQPWAFYLKDIDVRIKGGFNSKSAVEWEKFRSNIIVNQSKSYDSPFFDFKNFLMIGGVTKKSFNFRTLASLAGIDYEKETRSRTFSYEKYNQYDTIKMLSNLAKYDRKFYDSDVLDKYAEKIYAEDGTLIHNGIVDTDENGLLENTGITEIDLGNVSVFNKPISMWEHLGFSSVEFDNPGNNFYWKNIIPKNYGLENRTGVTQESVDLNTGPKDRRQGIVSEIKTFVIDENIQQQWIGGYTYPILPNMNKFGNFVEDVNIENSYGDSNIANITKIGKSNSSLEVNISYVDDEIVDLASSAQNLKILNDFSVDIDDDDRIIKTDEDFFDFIEIDIDKQAY